MPEIASSLRPNGRPVLLTAAAAVAGMLVAAAAAMWVYYGSAVFFEIMVAGFQACF
jgi:multidrug efflux pump subunit AcrB